MNALLAPRPQRFRIPAGFIAVALLFYSIDGAIVHSPVFAEKPDLLAAAVSFDLTLGVTLAWWLMVVRPGHAVVRTILPVFVASIAAAMLTLPAGHRDLLRDLRYLAIPFELAVIGVVVAGVRATNRRLAAAGTQLDIPERIRAALGTNVVSRVADVVAMEGAIFYYALASWRRKPFAPDGALAFSYHKKNGYAGILYTLARMSLVEAVALDFVIRARSPHAANIFLAVDLFAAFWLLGFARAVQLRPILLARDTLHVRMGLQWSLDVPRSNIESVEYGRITPLPKKTPGYLRLAPQPNVTFTLRTPMRARGAYGIARTVSRVAFVIDDIKKFREAFNG